MSSKKTSGRRKRAPRGEYRLHITAYSPETMPMARLAEYMAELAAILGSPGYVHFVKVDGGSTSVVHQVEREAIPKVQERTDAVRAGEAPKDALDAYDRINKYLRQDNARGVLRRGRTGAKILEFPGIKEAEEPFPNISQPGTISGFIERVGGAGDQVPVLMKSEGQVIAGCHANREVAKELAHHLFEPVRLHGQGYWTRTVEGEWEMRHFRINTFEPLSTASLSTALTELRAIAGDVEETAYRDLKILREG